MDTNVIANIKGLGLDMIQESGSGHPGVVLGAAPILYTLYSKHMNISFSDPKWIGRDRFILSAGHGSALLYATLYMAGFPYSIEDLKKFRKFGSITPGHPEIDTCPAVEATTGLLGQGLAMGVGMALGGKIIKDTFVFPKTSLYAPNKPLLDYYTYVLCGDGDLMEGIGYESASFAGTMGLDNLIVLYDSNQVSLDGPTSMTFTENVLERFEAMNWFTEEVKNGEDVNAIDKAILKAKRSLKPSLIKINTIIGRGSLLEGTNSVHGKPLTEEDIDQIKRKLKVNMTPFTVSEQVRENFHNQISERGSKKYEIFHECYENYMKETGNSPLLVSLEKDYALDISSILFKVNPETREGTRVSSGRMMQTLARYIPYFIGGSADLKSSTMTYLNEYETIKKGEYTGRNIWFGVREHAMGAILNGLSLSHFKVFGSTFLAFADYMKPAIRLSAIMKRPVNYIFTHDSVNIGEDGPTHEPIEQLAMLRSTPNLHVYRPCDEREVIGCWKNMMKSSTTPNALILSRQETPILSGSNIDGVLRGAYVIHSEETVANAIIVATGTEVATAVHVATQLKAEKGLQIRVVSMPCKNLYEKETDAFKQTILPAEIPTFVLEAGSSYGWEGIATDRRYLITLDQFGFSGHKSEVLRGCNFSFEQIKLKIESLIK